MHPAEGDSVSVQPGEMRAGGQRPFPGLDVCELSEGQGKVPERIWGAPEKEEPPTETGCSGSGSVVFLVETGES